MTHIKDYVRASQTLETTGRFKNIKWFSIYYNLSSKRDNPELVIDKSVIQKCASRREYGRVISSRGHYSFKYEGAKVWGYLSG